MASKLDPSSWPPWLRAESARYGMEYWKSGDERYSMCVVYNLCARIRYDKMVRYHALQETILVCVLRPKKAL